LVWSYILGYENSHNPFPERSEQIAKWRAYSDEDIEADNEILKIANEINRQGIKKIDSLHIACALKARVDYFMTTDDGILKKASIVQSIKIVDPIMFIMEVSI